MYPLIFAWKPLFLQVLCDADCFHISVVQQCYCLDIYQCGLTGERQNCWICLPWQSCFLKTEQFLKRKLPFRQMIHIPVLLLLNSDSCGETKIPEENRMKR